MPKKCGLSESEGPLARPVSGCDALGSENGDVVEAEEGAQRIPLRGWRRDRRTKRGMEKMRVSNRR